MEKFIKWDYRLLSLFFAGCLGLGAELLIPELKGTFCSVGRDFAVPALSDQNRPLQPDSPEQVH
jgi:hypothetical protein